MKRLFTYSLRVYDFIRDAVLVIFHYRRRTNVCILSHPHKKKIIWCMIIIVHVINGYSR